MSAHEHPTPALLAARPQTPLHADPPAHSGPTLRMTAYTRPDGTWTVNCDEHGEVRPWPEEDPPRSATDARNLQERHLFQSHPDHLPRQPEPDLPPEPAPFTAADVSHALRCAARPWGESSPWGPCVRCLDLYQRARAAGDEDCPALSWEGPGETPVAPLLDLPKQEQWEALHARSLAFEATLRAPAPPTSSTSSPA